MRKYVKISSLGDTLELIKLSLEVDGDVTAMKGKYAIDCKSTLGVFALDFSTGVTLEYPNDATELDTYLNKFEVATNK